MPQHIPEGGDRKVEQHSGQPQDLKKKNIRLALILAAVAFAIYAGFIIQHI